MKHTNLLYKVPRSVGETRKEGNGGQRNKETAEQGNGLTRKPNNLHR